MSEQVTEAAVLTVEDHGLTESRRATNQWE